MQLQLCFSGFSSVFFTSSADALHVHVLLSFIRQKILIKKVYEVCHACEGEKVK